jgi:uncharacterized membrane protein
MTRSHIGGTPQLPAGRRRPPRGDDGRILLLGLLYGLLAILLVTVVVSATGVHLERKRLLAVADLAALEAADALDEGAYFGRGDVAGGAGAADDVVVLTDGSVRAAVESYLATASPPAGLEDLALVDATTDGDAVTVTLAARSRPVLLTYVTAGWSDGVDLVVTSSARTG